MFCEFSAFRLGLFYCSKNVFAPNECTSVSSSISKIIAPHAGNLARETTPVSQISLHAIFVPVTLRNLNIKLGRIYLPSILQQLLLGLPLPVTLLCSMEKCQHSIKATFKKVKSQIQKGADPERAVRRGYDNTHDCFEIMNKRILIQQKALACLSKSVAHILQRELYTIGNTGLLRQESEMTLLQPHLGDSRCQELRNSPFWPSPLFKSQLVKDGEDFLLKKGTLKTLRVLDPTKTSSFVVPTTKRKEPTGR